MKKVNKPRIIERLRSRFALTDVEREIFTLGENVILVTNVDELLKEWYCEQVGTFSRLGASGAGGVIAYTIPTGKRFHIRALLIYRSSGDGQITNLDVVKKQSVPVYIQAPASGMNTNIFEQDLVMDEDFALNVYISSITTDSVWTITLYCAKEDAF